MSNTQPILGVPPPLPEGKNRYQEMAQASWLAPLFAIGVNFMLIVGQGGRVGQANKIQMVLGPLLIVSGFILGIAALFGIRKYGKRRILAPALAGVALNLLLIVAGAVPILLHVANRAQLQPAVHSPSAHLLNDNQLRFSIDIPEGFRSYPEGKNAPTIEHVYVKGTLGGAEALTVINIERLPGLIPKNKPLLREQMPPGFSGELTTRNWRGVKVDTIIATVQQADVKMVVYTVQIPLRPAAIQLNVGGPESKREELAHLTDALLSSLDGETNW